MKRLFVSSCNTEGHFRPWLRGLCLLSLACLSLGLNAQLDDRAMVNESESQEEIAAIIDDLPQVRHLSAALAEPVSHQDTVLTIIAVARLLDYGARLDSGDFESISARFRDERAWLDRLAARFENLPRHAPVYDPPAWYLMQELAQHSLRPTLNLSPLGPTEDMLLAQLFDRSNEASAAALLPALVARMEMQSTLLWSRLLDRVASNGFLLSAVIELNTEWFDVWIAAEPPAPLADETPDDEISDSIESLKIFAQSVIEAGPPDSLRLRRLRYSLLRDLPQMDPQELEQAQYILLMAAATDGLSDANFLGFSESLLWVASDLLLHSAVNPLAEVHHQAVARALSDMLPVLSNNFSSDFAAVDPRINTSLAAVFDVVQYLQAGTVDPIRLAQLNGGLADSMAQMSLMIPDMAFYFDQPVRRRISEEINVCISIAAAPDERGLPTFAREQFDACLQSLNSLAASAINTQELSGDPDGPFGNEQVRRELMLTPWQRVNFILGYLHENNSTGCELPEPPLASPLEWAVIANMLVWFADQSPVYLRTPENEQLLLSMQQKGVALLQTLSLEVDCFTGSGSGINDPIMQSLEDYRASLMQLVRALRQKEIEYREARLKPGADVMLQGNANQETAFRSEELVIRPCTTTNICEMSSELKATRALIGLFPDPYLIADQTRLGQIEICYDNVQWVSRRSEPVREDDPYVANYFGRLSFDLRGRYRHNNEVTEVFHSSIISPEEYHYLFAAATEEVLQDECPTEWVGSRITTSLNIDRKIRVVPDRLTYLAGARKKPSEVLAANWSRGAEWRDWFVTGLGVSRHELPADNTIVGRVDQHLQALHQAAQAEMYSELLTSRSGGAFQAASLNDLLQELSTSKALIRSQLNVFYPQVLLESDEIRGALEGTYSLVDENVMRRFSASKTAIERVNQAGLTRLEDLQTTWARQPEIMRRSGSVSLMVAHALSRLTEIYQRQFSLQNQLPSPELEALPPFD